MVPATTSLIGFSGETIWPLGQLRLLVTIGDADHSTKAWMNFIIVRSLSPYNGIIGRPGIREIQAVPYMVHGMLKFPFNRGIVTICSTILIPAECTTKKRGQAPERAMAIQAEVQKLVEAGIMREVYYHDWSNPVMVKKHDGSWRMYVERIEAKVVATIIGNQVKKFVWDNIVCRFGIPGEIVSDNGKQFSDNPFKDWCDKLNITQRFTSMKHTQSNGLVERANRSLGEEIKALDRGTSPCPAGLSHND
ncbi:reverse transcriptase domain-containing protein [Tanacetum coccineum]